MRINYEAFNNAEEVWFWFCHCISARGDGLRSKSDYPGLPRNCEVGDICQILKQMKARHQISNRHLRILSKWGMMNIPPYYRGKPSEIRLWEEAIRVLDVYLRSREIL